MAKYKRVDAANGRTMYYRDGVMVSIKDIPEGVVRQLEPDMELEFSAPGTGNAPENENPEALLPSAPPLPPVDGLTDEENETIANQEENDDTSDGTQDVQLNEAPVRKCLDCGDEARFRKFLQLKDIWLCEKHYRAYTTGEVVALMRERNIIPSN